MSKKLIYRVRTYGCFVWAFAIYFVISLIMYPRYAGKKSNDGYVGMDIWIPNDFWGWFWLTGICFWILLLFLERFGFISLFSTYDGLKDELQREENKALEKRRQESGYYND